jgi:tRNA pseudouridine38-40 synthase
MRNIQIIVEYDGTAYHGWQRQKSLPTIQQLLEDSIGRVTQERVTVIGAGRTDAGVHALNQSARFMTSSNLGTKSLLMGINSLLPYDVVVKELNEMGELFHARFDVKSKIYLYQIFNAEVRSVLYRNYAWHVRAPLDLHAMEEGLDILKGVHEFSSFCGKKDADADCIRTITDAHIEKKNHELVRIYIEADGFLRYMVRTIVGTLVEVGLGKRMPLELADILEAKDRKSAGITAPPHGLFLIEVKY